MQLPEHHGPDVELIAVGRVLRSIACVLLFAAAISCRATRDTPAHETISPREPSEPAPAPSAPPTAAPGASHARPSGLMRRVDADRFCEGSSSGNETPHAFAPGAADPNAPSADRCVFEGTNGAVTELYCCP